MAEHSWTSKLLAFTESWPFQAVVVVAIVLAGAVVGIETYPSMLEKHGTLLHFADRIVLAVFTIELVLRIASHGRAPHRFFRDGWNVLDFAIVAVSYMPFVSQSLLVIRLFRLLRLVRLLKMVPELRLLVETVLHTLPSMGYLAGLFGLLFYIYAVLGTFAFGPNDPLHFGNLQLSFLSLFQVLTLEGWADLLQINIYGCASYGYEASQALCTRSQGHPILATIYFVSFVLVGTFLMLNMVIGFIMENLQSTKARHLEEARRRPGFPEQGLEDRIARIRDDLAALEREILRKK